MNEQLAIKLLTADSIRLTCLLGTQRVHSDVLDLTTAAPTDASFLQPAFVRTLQQLPDMGATLFRGDDTLNVELVIKISDDDPVKAAVVLSFVRGAAALVEQVEQLQSEAGCS